MKAEPSRLSPQKLTADLKVLVASILFNKVVPFRAFLSVKEYRLPFDFTVTTLFLND